jgi:hypothetical protein
VAAHRHKTGPGTWPQNKVRDTIHKKQYPRTGYRNLEKTLEPPKKTRGPSTPN